MIDDLDARFEAAIENGRVLARSSESRIVHVEPFLLAAERSGHAVDLLIRRITLLAFTLSAIISFLVLVGAAPRPVAIFVVAWLLPGLGARWYARRRRSELGRTLVDFEDGKIEHGSVDGRRTSAELATARLVVTRTHDIEAPLSLVLRGRDRRKIRLARVTEPELDRVLLVFRRYKIAVEGPAPDDD